MTFTANGTMNGNIEVTDTGEFVSIAKGDNLLYEQGQGVIATKDGSETANYTFIDVVDCLLKFPFPIFHFVFLHSKLVPLSFSDLRLMIY